MSIEKGQLAGLTRKQREYVKAIEYNLKGLQVVSTGLCSGCETCKDEYGLEVSCECGAPEAEGPHCDLCDDTGLREPTEEEFEEQVSSGEVFCEPFFSWSGCDICGSNLGGNFEPWHGVDASGKIVCGDYACVNCVQYLANDTLPENNE